LQSGAQQRGTPHDAEDLDTHHHLQHHRGEADLGVNRAEAVIAFGQHRPANTGAINDTASFGRERQRHAVLVDQI
jgi:hypothetical protein